MSSFHLWSVTNNKEQWRDTSTINIDKEKLFHDRIVITIFTNNMNSITFKRIHVDNRPIDVLYTTCGVACWIWALVIQSTPSTNHVNLGYGTTPATTCFTTYCTVRFHTGALYAAQLLPYGSMVLTPSNSRGSAGRGTVIAYPGRYLGCPPPPRSHFSLCYRYERRTMKYRGTKSVCNLLKATWWGSVCLVTISFHHELTHCLFVFLSVSQSPKSQQSEVPQRLALSSVHRITYL